MQENSVPLLRREYTTLHPIQIGCTPTGVAHQHYHLSASALPACLHRCNSFIFRDRSDFAIASMFRAEHCHLIHWRVIESHKEKRAYEEESLCHFYWVFSTRFTHHPQFQSTLPPIPILTGKFGTGICSESSAKEYHNIPAPIA